MEDVSREELNIFIDMFELFPIYTSIFQLNPMLLVVCDDGTILNSTWESRLVDDIYFM